MNVSQLSGVLAAAARRVLEELAPHIEVLDVAMPDDDVLEIEIKPDDFASEFAGTIVRGSHGELRRSQWRSGLCVWCKSDHPFAAGTDTREIALPGIVECGECAIISGCDD